ncbi:MAG: ABC transporter ATP-binding protein [Gammaproteobacteria bacterium]
MILSKARHSPTTTTPIAQLRRVSKVYLGPAETINVLKELDFVLHEGEFVVLLGRSGSGKSTLLNLISGIDMPSQGEVFFRGTCLSSLGENERTLFRRHHIGFIFQTFNLIPTLTVEENILLPLELIGINSHEQSRRAKDLLQRMALGERAAHFPDQLSGGEQQRVAIARAIIHEPDLILADEPTGNLDLETGQEVLAILEQTVRETGKAMIMATHSAEFAELADRMLTIRDGRLFEPHPPR